MSTRRPSDAIRKEKYENGMVFGSYDILHPGHVIFIHEAIKHCEILRVVVARDENILQIKGKEPENHEGARLMLMNSMLLAMTEYYNSNRDPEKQIKIGTYHAVLGCKFGGDRYACINEWRPEVICLGYDQKSVLTKGLPEKLKEFGLKDTKILPLEISIDPERFKSSKLRLEDRKVIAAVQRELFMYLPGFQEEKEKSESK
jgi:FAD synthetase